MFWDAFSTGFQLVIHGAGYAAGAVVALILVAVVVSFVLEMLG